MLENPINFILKRVQPCSSVLSVGCQDSGKGVILSRNGMRVKFLDINNCNLEIIRANKLNNVEFINKNILDLETFEKFDIILLNRLFHIFSYPDQIKIMHLITNYTQVGSYVHVTWPNLDNFITIKKFKELFAEHFKIVFQRVFKKKDNFNHEHIIRSVILSRYK